MGNEKEIERLLKVDEVAERLSVSRRTVYRFRDSGFMPPAIKLGGAVRWRERDIQEWIADGCPNMRRTRWTPRRTR